MRLFADVQAQMQFLEGTAKDDTAAPVGARSRMFRKVRSPERKSVLGILISSVRRGRLSLLSRLKSCANSGIRRISRAPSLCTRKRRLSRVLWCLFQAPTETIPPHKAGEANTRMALIRRRVRAL